MAMPKTALRASFAGERQIILQARGDAMKAVPGSKHPDTLKLFARQGSSYLVWIKNGIWVPVRD